MKQNIIHIGLDVDDKQYHSSALSHTTGEILDLQWRPNLISVAVIGRRNTTLILPAIVVVN